MFSDTDMPLLAELGSFLIHRAINIQLLRS